MKNEVFIPCGNVIRVEEQEVAKKNCYLLTRLRDRVLKKKMYADSMVLGF